MLNHGGFLLIRIPKSDSFAFRKYRSNWFQIDAPRHFFLHTTRSMVLLSKKAGFVLKEIDYDSTADQFLESENYCRDISWNEYIEDPANLYHPRYVKDCKKHARLLNQTMDGDQACFIFLKN
jgi:predicted SAM-dependent methyltransferase